MYLKLSTSVIFTKSSVPRTVFPRRVLGVAVRLKNPGFFTNRREVEYRAEVALQSVPIQVFRIDLKLDSLGHTGGRFTVYMTSL